MTFIRFGLALGISAGAFASCHSFTAASWRAGLAD